MKRIKAIDGLRGISIILVVLDHAGKTLPLGEYSGWLWPFRLIAQGDLGVEIFFILSGFLITSILKNEYEEYGHINKVDFYKRRVLRIFPAFYCYMFVLCTLTMLCYLHIYPTQFLFAGLHIWNYSHFAHLKNCSDGSWYLGHFWTMSLEEQFYWIGPAFILFLLQSRNLFILKFLIVLVPALRIISYFLMPESRGQLTMMFHTGFDSILIGSYFALDRKNIEIRLIKFLNNQFWLIGFLLFFFLFRPLIFNSFHGYWSCTYGRTIEGFMIGILLIYALQNNSGWFNNILNHSVVIYIGKISFSLYLWQQLFLPPGTLKLLPLDFPLNIFAAFLLANLSYYMIEKPFLKIKDKKFTPTIKPSPTFEIC